MKYGEVNLGQTEALLNKIGGVVGMNKILSGEWIVGEPTKVAKAKSGASTKVLAGLLELTGEPTKMSAIERFVARDKFVVNRQGELPISYLGDNFRNNFLDVVEENVPACTLKQRKLLKASVDTPILNALGDKDLAKIEKARSALAHTFDYLKTDDRSKWYIFYVADAKGIVWAVSAYWDGDGWYVGADPVSDPDQWRAFNHVVSR
jgi:hypothetical protein